MSQPSALGSLGYFLLSAARIELVSKGNRPGTGFQPSPAISSFLKSFTLFYTNKLQWVNHWSWLSYAELKMHQAYERMTWHEWHSHVTLVVARDLQSWHFLSHTHSISFLGNCERSCCSVGTASWQRQAMVVLLVAAERSTQRAPLLAGQRGSKISYPANSRKLTNVSTTL
jgi:hypothetical protein